MDVCIATIGALCKHLPWSAYKAQLKQAMVLLAKLHSNKMTVRFVVCSLCICIFYTLYFYDTFIYYYRCRAEAVDFMVFASKNNTS